MHTLRLEVQELRKELSVSREETDRLRRKVTVLRLSPVRPSPRVSPGPAPLDGLRTVPSPRTVTSAHKSPRSVEADRDAAGRPPLSSIDLDEKEEPVNLPARDDYFLRHIERMVNEKMAAFARQFAPRESTSASAPSNGAPEPTPLQQRRPTQQPQQRDGGHSSAQLARQQLRLSLPQQQQGRSGTA